MGSVRRGVVRFLIERSTLWNQPLERIRGTMAGIKAKPISSAIETERTTINHVECDVFHPKEKHEGKVVIYFHGGGFCLGSYAANRQFVSEIARSTGAAVFMPDYRLAPEHPFPAALEDAVRTYRGVFQQGYCHKDVVVMGDSSGCSLALSALMTVRDSGEVLPTALAFITPVFDFDNRRTAAAASTTNDPFRLKDPLGIAKHYIADNNPQSPMISPLYGDLTGLPDTLIHGAGDDVFSGDSKAYAEAVSAAGGAVDLKVWNEMWHIFHMQASLVPESKKAFEELCAYVKAKLCV